MPTLDLHSEPAETPHLLLDIRVTHHILNAEGDILGYVGTEMDKFSYSIKSQPELKLQGRYLNRIWTQEEATEFCMRQIRVQLEK